MLKDYKDIPHSFMLILGTRDTSFVKLKNREKSEFIRVVLHAQKQKLLTWPISNNLR